jgi:hypothetical protein
VSCTTDKEAFIIKTLHCPGDYCVVCCVGIRLELCLVGEPCDNHDNLVVAKALNLVILSSYNG